MSEPAQTRRPPAEAPLAVMHLISSLGIGGAERLLVDTLNIARGHPGVRYVVVIMNETVNQGFLAEIKASGAPVYHLNRAQGHLHPRYLGQLATIVDQHGIGIIHTHNEGSRGWGMLVKLLRPRLKLVYTVHSVDNAADITGIKRLAYRMVDATVAISKAVAESVAPLRAKRLTLVPNGIALDRFAALAGRQTPNGPFRVVSVGRFIPQKGQDILIEAMQRCIKGGADIHCTLVGANAEPPYLDRLRQQVRDLGLEDRVSFVVDRTDIEGFLAQADAFVLSSRWEGFGLVVVEAMAAGLPVIVSDLGGPAEIVEQGISGLKVAGDDPAALADAIRRLAADPSLCRALGAGGRRRAGQYDIRTMNENLVALYARLAGPS